MPACPNCSSPVTKYANFCMECGAGLEVGTGNGGDDQDRIDSKRQVTDSHKRAGDFDINLRSIFDEFMAIREVRVGGSIIIISFLMFLLISNVPIAKTTSSEEGYMAYYDMFLERTPNSDKEAPREMIEDEAMEDVFLVRISMIQSGIGLLLLLGLLIMTVGYLGLGSGNEVIYDIRNDLFSRLIQISCFFLLAYAFSFVGLAVEFLTIELVLLPIITLYLILLLSIVMKTSGSLTEGTTELSTDSFNIAYGKLENIYAFAAFALILISSVPWSIGMVEDSPTHMITEPGLAASGISEFQIYELKVMQENIESISNVLWAIIAASILGFISLRIIDSKKEPDILCRLFLLVSNSIVLMSLFLLYTIYKLVTAIADYELYFNEIVANENERADFFYFCNFFPLISGLLILAYSVIYSKLTLQSAIDRLI